MLHSTNCHLNNFNYFSTIDISEIALRLRTHHYHQLADCLINLQIADIQARRLLPSVTGVSPDVVVSSGALMVALSSISTHTSSLTRVTCGKPADTSQWGILSSKGPSDKTSCNVNKMNFFWNVNKLKQLAQNLFK